MKIVKKIFAKKSIYTNYTENTKKNLLDNSNFEDNCTATKEQATICNKKFSKIVCSFGLAALLGAMALFGAACTPNSAATSGPQGTQSAAGGSASTGSSTSPFNLNPETDPVLFTTQSGIDIKFGGATVESGGLTGYTYITMGTYGGNPVHWVIIGYHSSLSYLFGEDIIVGGNDLINGTIDDSPAGEAIKNNNLYFIFGQKNDQDLEYREVLLLSETSLGESTFGNTSSYNASALKKAVDNLYDINLGLSDKEKDKMVSKNIVTTYPSGTLTTMTSLFPLAAFDENFSINTYLNSNSLRNLGADYWLRSGSDNTPRAKHIASGGSMSQCTSTYTKAVRPAFVMKLV